VIYPILQETALRAKVHWVSGSMAGKAPASIFFQQHAPNIDYIQCAIRDLPRDAVLLADVSGDSIRWEAVSLTGMEMLNVLSYDATWWERSLVKKQPFNPRLIPLYIRQGLSSALFWYGAGFMLLLLVLVRRTTRRWL
jgi:hypothetical protein